MLSKMEPEGGKLLNNSFRCDINILSYQSPKVGGQSSFAPAHVFGCKCAFHLQSLPSIEQKVDFKQKMQVGAWPQQAITIKRGKNPKHSQVFGEIPSTSTKHSLCSVNTAFPLFSDQYPSVEHFQSPLLIRSVSGITLSTVLNALLRCSAINDYLGQTNSNPSRDKSR